MCRLACSQKFPVRRLTVGALVAVMSVACWRDIADDENAGASSALEPDFVFADDSLGWIMDIALVGDRLVALDVMLAPAIHVFDLNSPRRLGSYGREGDGPGEFNDLEQAIPGAPESVDDVWILDGGHMRLTRLSLADIEQNRDVDVEMYRLDGLNAESIARAPNGQWFAGGRIMGGRVARYRADRSYDRTIVGFPPEAPEVPGMTLPQAYESWVAVHPAGDRLAAATLMGGLLEIFDYDGGLIARAAVPDPFQPAWAQKRSVSGRAVNPGRRYGFVDLAATGRYLYGVFSGRLLDEERPAWLTREVQVYTWDGEYVKTLHLDRRVEAIAIDDSDTWLYAAGLEPSPWVGRFRLPEPGLLR